MEAVLDRGPDLLSRLWQLAPDLNAWVNRTDERPSVWEREMKVMMCEQVTVDVETMIDVSVQDVLMEFSRRMEAAEFNDELPVKSCFLPLLDFATKLLAQVPTKGIHKCTDSQRAEMVRRLEAEAERWNTIYMSAED